MERQTEIATEIFERYRPKAQERHKLLLLPATDALDCIRECHRAGLTLLGFDAFRLLPEDHTQPVMEYSIDVSDLQHESLSLDEKYYEAEQLLSSCPDKSLWYELVVQEFLQ